MVAGDLVNVAARLQSVAEPGAVLVGESTMRAASAAITFEPLGEQALKGKSSPIPAESTVDPLNAPAMLLLASRAAMWSRDRESLRRAEAAYGQAASHGRYVEAHARAMRAGIDGLDGRIGESLAGFLDTARQFAELRVPIDQAVNAINMAAVLGTSAPEVEAEVEVARSILEDLGAAAYLTRLESVVALGGTPHGRDPISEGRSAGATVANPA